MRPETLDSALVLALTVEAVDQASDNERPRKPSPTNDTVTAAVTANDSQIIQMLNNLGEKLEQQRKQSAEQAEEILSKSSYNGSLIPRFAATTVGPSDITVGSA